MKIKELIEILQKLDQEADVYSYKADECFDLVEGVEEHYDYDVIFSDNGVALSTTQTKLGYYID